MSKYIAGIIGAGNMGGIIASAVCKKVGRENVIVACSSADNSKLAAEKIGCGCGTAAEIAENVRFLFLGIKPQKASEVISEIKNIIVARQNDGLIIVSMLAGTPISMLCEMCGTDRIIRMMPNTPALVGEGMTQVCCASGIGGDELCEFCELISYTGRTDIIPESLIDAASAVSGCGPAYAYIFIEALADGAVKCGLPRKKAVEYAAQMLYGAAKTMLKTEKHPGELKDAVCSPAGSTIAGVSALENGAFRACASNAVVSAFLKTKEMAEKKHG